MLMKTVLLTLVTMLGVGSQDQDLVDDGAVAKPTQVDVSYGPHKLDVLDFWKAKGEGPRPLLVYIHGGGWTGGDKELKPENVLPYLKKGISVASINYRLT